MSRDAADLVSSADRPGTVTVFYDTAGVYYSRDAADLVVDLVVSADRPGTVTVFYDTAGVY
jgi:hypothetical protein